MNKDQFKGLWSQFKGEAKKQWGQFTDDDLMQVEGDYDKFMGVVQQRYGDQREQIQSWTDQWFQQYGERRAS